MKSGYCAEALSAMENRSSSFPTEKPLLMAVEDDDNIAYLLQFLLEREGYSVRMARNGNEARQLIDELPPPQLVILDIMVPYFDGFELLQLIREKSDWASTPVIMLTAKSQERDIVRALDSGASDYIVKPFLPEELKARVRRWVRVVGK